VGLIPKSIALKYSGQAIRVRKGDSVFREGEPALFFYQVEEGSVKMVTSSEDGREFIQGVFHAGESFGEPPLFCHIDYPATAIAITDSHVLKIPKDRFFQLLQENFAIHLRFDEVLCQSLRYKNMILSEVSFHTPEHRLQTLFRHLRETLPKKQGHIEVPFTRQVIADMIGLRVETVIRSIKKMESEGKLTLKGGKIRL